MGHADGVYRLLGTSGKSKSMPGHVRALHLRTVVCSHALWLVCLEQRVLNLQPSSSVWGVLSLFLRRVKNFGDQRLKSY